MKRLAVTVTDDRCLIVLIVFVISQPSENDDTEIKKASAEIARLREELSSTQRENLQLKVPIHNLILAKLHLTFLVYENCENYVKT